MSQLPLSVIRFDPELPLPSYARKGDAGLDLYASLDVLIPAQARKLVPTGFAVAIPEGYAGFIQPRSGLAYKSGITVLNTPGLIDSGYRGELKVLLYNSNVDADHQVNRGDRIAQLVIQKVETVEIVEVEQLPETERGDGGFGSTGV